LLGLCLMPLKLSDAGLAVLTAVASRLPLRLRGSFLTELAASFSGHEGEGLRRLAVEAAKWVVRIEAAESRASIPARVPGRAPRGRQREHALLALAVLERGDFSRLRLGDRFADTSESGFEGTRRCVDVVGIAGRHKVPPLSACGNNSELR